MSKTRKPLALETPIGDAADPRGFWQRLLAYRQWLLVQNYAETTVRDRFFHLRSLGAWLEERGVSRPADVTLPMLERYERYLFHYRKEDGRPLTFRHQRTRLASIRAFFKWLAKSHLVLYNPASELPMPRRETRLPPPTLTAAEVEAVLNQTDVATPLGLRDRAILEVFYSTAIRRSELIHLELQDVDSGRGTLMVRQGKGKKDRVVPIGSRALAWLEKYQADARPLLVVGPDAGTVFVSELGKPLGKDRLSRLVTDYIDAAGVGKRGSCHLFRHSVATLMLEGGADIRYIQQMLGHAKLETTQVYTQVSIGQLKAIHEATHPASRADRPAVKASAADPTLLSSLGEEDED
jgi:integrase/recombinase XerD